VQDTLYYSDGIRAAVENGHKIIRRGSFLLRDNNDVFVPALWSKAPAIIAYSEDGYDRRRWLLPEEWSDVKKVDLYLITPLGDKVLQKDVAVDRRQLTLSLDRGIAVAIKPSGSQGTLQRLIKKL
jgi:hypothetical protein